VILLNKVAVITGAANGIGAGVAELFISEGAKVFLLDCDGERNARLVESLSGSARAITCDVRNADDVRLAIDSVLAETGRVDTLINNAGVYPRQSFLEMTEHQWDDVQNVNLKSMFYVCKAVLPHMVSQKSGRIVNISSVTFHLGTANLTHYVASKGGIIGFTRSLAREVGEHGVVVNCITPGAVLVDAERKVATEEQIQAIVDLQSIKRRILPLDIARVCLFLSCELSSAMTGQTLNVDGGWVMY
jgi:3-oxoacyl-[acyl-carrier protein] reductase